MISCWKLNERGRKKKEKHSIRKLNLKSSFVIIIIIIIFV